MTTTNPVVTGDTTTDVHTFFGLSYCDHLVVPRTLAQSMPAEWQENLVRLITEMQEAFTHVEQPDRYIVEAAKETYLGDFDDTELRANGYTRETVDCDCVATAGQNGGRTYPGCQHDDRFYDRDGNEVDPHERVLIRTPDPIPHHNRGRTHIEPRIPARP